MSLCGYQIRRMIDRRGVKCGGGTKGSETDRYSEKSALSAAIKAMIPDNGSAG